MSAKKALGEYVVDYESNIWPGNIRYRVIHFSRAINDWRAAAIYRLLLSTSFHLIQLDKVNKSLHTALD